MKKKICFVAEYMLCGGTEKSLLSLLPLLDRNKYDITLLLMKKKGDLLTELPEDIKVHEIPLPKELEEELLNSRKNALIQAFKKGEIIQVIKKLVAGFRMVISTNSDVGRRLWYYKSIKNKIQEYPEMFDVVIDYMGYGLFNSYYAAEKIKGKVKISWVHFEPKICMADFGDFKEVLQKFQYIMCVSKETQRNMLELIPELADRYRVFYNIVNEEELKKKSDLREIKKDRDVFSIVSIGRLDHQKGFDLGIEVIERLCKEGYAIRWYIIGEGNQRAELEQKISETVYAKESIVLLGQQLNPYPYLKMCDLYFQPSRHEGYGIAVAEARAFCKPIVSTNFAGAQEQLINNETGIITECTIESMYRGVKLLLDNYNDFQHRFSKNLAAQKGIDKNQVCLLEQIFEQV